MGVSVWERADTLEDREEEFFHQVQRHCHDHDYKNSVEADLLENAPQEVSRMLSYYNDLWSRSQTDTPMGSALRITVCLKGKNYAIPCSCICAVVGMCSLHNRVEDYLLCYDASMHHVLHCMEDIALFYYVEHVSK